MGYKIFRLGDYCTKISSKRIEIQSTIILAIKSDTRPAFISSDTSIDSLLGKRVNESIPLNQAIPYDNFTPVDYLAFREIDSLPRYAFQIPNILKSNFL